MPHANRRRALLAIAAPLVLPLARPGAQPLAAPADWRLSKGVEWPAFAGKFAELGTRGGLVLLDALRGGRIVVDEKRAMAAYPPGATFHVAMTLIALQAGAAKDIDDEKLPAAAGASEPARPACAGEATLRDAFRHSCEPAFRELARRVGLDGFREWLTRLDYGNGAPGPAPDSFWLDGDLRISADAQAKFLRRLVIKSLPVSPRAASLTETAMFIEKIGDTAIHGAAGNVGSPGPMAWWIGYAQRGEDVVIVALNFDAAEKAGPGAGYDLAKSALAGVGML